jgi:hypothetical protein
MGTGRAGLLVGVGVEVAGSPAVGVIGGLLHCARNRNMSEHRKMTKKLRVRTVVSRRRSFILQLALAGQQPAIVDRYPGI